MTYEPPKGFGEMKLSAKVEAFGRAFEARALSSLDSVVGLPSYDPTRCHKNPSGSGRHRWDAWLNCKYCGAYAPVTMDRKHHVWEERQRFKRNTLCVKAEKGVAVEKSKVLCPVCGASTFIESHTPATDHPECSTDRHQCEKCDWYSDEWPTPVAPLCVKTDSNDTTGDSKHVR